MGPYRPLHVYREPADGDVADNDDRVLGGALILLGLVRVIPAVCVGEAFGSEATIALAMVVVGIGLVTRLRRRVARVHR